jgi:hypothetical protein
VRFLSEQELVIRSIWSCSQWFFVGLVVLAQWSGDSVSCGEIFCSEIRNCDQYSAGLWDLSAEPEMAGFPVLGYQAFWAEDRASLQAEYEEIKKQYPDAETQYRRLFDILCDMEDVASFTPAAVGESAKWVAIVSAPDDNRANYCKALSGKTLFNALYGNYTVTPNELKSLVKASASGTKNPAREEGFKEVRRRKRESTAESAPTP